MDGSIREREREGDGTRAAHVSLLAWCRRAPSCVRAGAAGWVAAGNWSKGTAKRSAKSDSAPHITVEGRSSAPVVGI